MTSTLGEMADQVGWPAVAVLFLDQRNVAWKLAIDAGVEKSVLLAEFERLRSRAFSEAVCL